MKDAQVCRWYRSHDAGWPYTTINMARIKFECTDHDPISTAKISQMRMALAVAKTRTVLSRGQLTQAKGDAATSTVCAGDFLQSVTSTQTTMTHGTEYWHAKQTRQQREIIYSRTCRPSCVSLAYRHRTIAELWICRFVVQVRLVRWWRVSPSTNVIKN